MKKILPLIFVAALLSSCGAVRLALDTRDEDGDRVILTSDKHLFNHIDVALGAKIMDQKDTVLAVLVTYDGPSNHGVFNLDNQLKFRLADDSVISLTNMYDKEFEKNTETYTTNDLVSDVGYAYAYNPYTSSVYVTPYEVSSFVPRMHTRTSTLSYGLYLITKQQLHNIIEKGVVKFRVEIENAELDMLSGTEKISAVFAEQYSCLKENLNNPHLRSDF